MACWPTSCAGSASWPCDGVAVTAALEARDVVVTFGGLTALAGVDLEVAPGATVGLVGPNGAGKSTLFGVCSGLLRPDRGRVRLAGRDVTGHTPQARARAGLARTFQQPQVFAGLTVAQHLALADRVSSARSRLWSDMWTAAGLRRPDREEAARVGSILDLLGLAGLAGELVDHLPLGTTRLVEVGRALAARPSVVLLDEPLSGLDSLEATRLLDALRAAVRERGVALLLVDHDFEMVAGLCERIHVLDFGHLIAAGAPQAVRTDPAVRAAYLGEDPSSSLDPR
jgi:ABC-type branched-subunit amino acid transport system ATPase component